MRGGLGGGGRGRHVLLYMWSDRTAMDKRPY